MRRAVTGRWMQVMKATSLQAPYKLYLPLLQQSNNRQQMNCFLHSNSVSILVQMGLQIKPCCLSARKAWMWSYLSYCRWSAQAKVRAKQPGKSVLWSQTKHVLALKEASPSPGFSYDYVESLAPSRLAFITDHGTLQDDCAWLYISLQEFVPRWFVEVVFEDGDLYTWKKVLSNFSRFIFCQVGLMYTAFRIQPLAVDISGSWVIGCAWESHIPFLLKRTSRKICLHHVILCVKHSSKYMLHWRTLRCPSIRAWRVLKLFCGAGLHCSKSDSDKSSLCLSSWPAEDRTGFRKPHWSCQLCCHSQDNIGHKIQESCKSTSKLPNLGIHLRLAANAWLTKC